MERLSQQNIHPHILQILNRCRLYLRVVTLSDITEGNGRYLQQSMTSGCCPLTITPYGWPNQQKPPQKHWELWHSALRQTFCAHGHSSILASPLGPWLSLQSHQQWFLDQQPTILYEQCSHQHYAIRYPVTGNPRRSAASLFSVRPQGHTTSLPTSALPTTVSLDPSSEFLQISGCRKFLSSPHSTPTGWYNQQISFVPVAQARQAFQRTNNTIMAVCDGSYKDQHGTAAWIVVPNDEPSVKISGKVVSPGNPADQDAYRAELAGIYAVIKFLQDFGQDYDLPQRVIQLGCDCKSALHRCFQPYCPLPSQTPHYDLVFANPQAPLYP